MVDSILIVPEANGDIGRSLCRHFGRSSETYYENHSDRALPTTLSVDAAFEVGDSLWLNRHDRSVAWFFLLLRHEQNPLPGWMATHLA